MNVRLVSMLVLFVSLPSFGYADDAELKKLVKEQVEALGNATVKGDFGKVADLTHPKVIDLMGGREKLIAQTEIVMSQMKNEGMEIKSFTVGEPSEIVKQGNDLFIYVPNKLVMTIKGGKISVDGYVVGVSSDQGKKWTFVNSDKGGNVKKILPNLPNSLKLPEYKAPVVEKD